MEFSVGTGFGRADSAVSRNEVHGRQSTAKIKEFNTLQKEQRQSRLTML
jgi:hypothetical protein